MVTAKIPLRVAIWTLFTTCSAQLLFLQHKVEGGLGPLTTALGGHRGLSVETCSDGTEGIDGNGVVCCPIGCGQCGGPGCTTSGAGAGLGSGDCCGAPIKSSGVYCDDTNEAPCIISSAPSKQTCSDGTTEGIDGNGVVCCPVGCGECGGSDCGTAGASAGLGVGDCCGGAIKSNGMYCDDTNEAPCIIGSDPDKQTCSDGTEGIDGNGVVCCPIGCGQCGGPGCTTSGAAAGLGSGDCCGGPIKSSGVYCDDTNEAPCIIGNAPESVPSPTPVPTEQTDACNPNPCNNGGSCALDPGGGHMCTCTSGYGGMSCQIDTTNLEEFSIELDFIIEDGLDYTWSQDEMDEFRSYADRWENIISHVPCGDGRLVIQAEWASRFKVNRPVPRAGCEQISGSGHITNGIGAQETMRRDDLWDSFVTHEMAHSIGIGYLWGKCTDCDIDGGTPPEDGSWETWDGDACPATYDTWLDLSGEPDGTVAKIVETDTGTIGQCVHFDFDTIPGEMNNKGTFHRQNPNDGSVVISKLTLAALEDIGYIVDPSKAEPFSLPA